MSVRGVGLVVCLATALIAAAQIRPVSAQFMQEMNGSMERMDRRMGEAPMNGNVDHDFAAMMIPHHKGAIDVAKAELLYGKDQVMRRLFPERFATEWTDSTGSLTLVERGLPSAWAGRTLVPDIDDAVRLVAVTRDGKPVVAAAPPRSVSSRPRDSTGASSSRRSPS